MRRRTFVALGAVTATAALAAAAGWSYSSDVVRVRARIEAIDRAGLATPFGNVEYALAGEGPPLLMIHGSGGGVDQALHFAESFVQTHRIIAPSRFGYLGSNFPEDASPDNQADAFALLLDALGIDRVAACGMSAGALSATAFALRHPERCAALILVVPAMHVPGRPAPRPWSALQTLAVNAVLRSDFLFWSALRLAPDMLTRSILATDPALVAALGAEDEVAAVRDGILPVSARARGLLNDMQRAGNPPEMALGDIAVPTRAYSAEDDLYDTAAAARHVAEAIPGAEAEIYPTGGHLLLGRMPEFTASVERFLEGRLPL